MARKTVTIGVFGRRKTGKSNLIQSLGGLGTAPGAPGAVANVPVRVAGLGSVNLIVPPGLDDERALGVAPDEGREVLVRVDVAALVIDAEEGWTDYEKVLVSRLHCLGTPVVTVVNRRDGDDTTELVATLRRYGQQPVALDLSGVADAAPFIKAVAAELKSARRSPGLVDGLVDEGDLVWLVVPARRRAWLEPVGPAEVRLTRDVIAAGGNISVVREAEFEKLWKDCAHRPRLIVADSSAFAVVVRTVPEDSAVTTLGVLLSRQRGELEAFVKGAEAIGKLKPGDRVLIAEACQLHAQPEDIARVEVPNLLRKYAGGDLEFSTTGGASTFEDIKGYALVVRCGACRYDRSTARQKLSVAKAQGTPVTNYGIALAFLHGLLPRIVAPFVAKGDIPAVQYNPARVIPLDLHDEFSMPPCM